jgi:exopolysaccharide production protein ExoZ
MEKNNTNLQSIQIMRGVASLLVVLTHIEVKGSQYGNGALKGFSVGGAGVDLFFIISGYVMCISTYARQVNFSQFIIRRIQRILPLYWLVTTIALIVYLYKPDLVNSSGGETSIFASYTLIPNGEKLLNQNGWTLSYEFFFYFVFGAFLSRGTYKAMQASSLILLSLVIIGLCSAFNEYLFNFFTSSYFVEFVFGMGCFYLFNMKAILVDPKYGAGLIVLGLLLFYLQEVLAIPYSEKWRGVVWGMKVLPIFAGLLSLEGLIRRSASLIKRVLLEIGNSSYSLYLIHPFTVSGTAICLRRLGMVSNPWLFAGILLVTSIIIGHLVYLYVERPLIFLTKKYFTRGALG